MTGPDRLAAALSRSYRIERELGQGGMATVYLAADLKHDRPVAIKVLKPDLAAVLGAERFIAEIKTTAALSHPHILPLFDSGEVEGFLYYVMPYIEGETIREKLTRETQFGIDEAVRITTEVADALDYAHRHGVIHRDIKPENILLHDGRAMVMDFGIALAVSAAAGGRMTETGLSLGTPHYMSPEQATADKAITARSDVYSLASVLFEMLAGEPPHSGGSAQAIIMKIVTDVPRPVGDLRKSVPPNVAAALANALEKVPADRFASATAFATALRDRNFEGSETGAQRGVSGGRILARGPVVPMLAATTVIALAIAAWALTRPAPPAPLVRYSMRLGDNVEVSNASTVLGGRLALSPDGMTLAFVGMQSDEPWVMGPALHVRSRGSLEPTRIGAVSPGRRPFWKPDGRTIGSFDEQGRLTFVSPTGDAPRRINTERFYESGGASWGTDGFIYLVSPGGLDGIHRMPEGGGASEQVTTIDTLRGEGPHLYPTILPESRGLLITIRFVNEPDRIAVVDLRTRERRDLVTGSGAWYSPSGHLLFLTDAGTLMAQPFDLGTLTVSGEQTAVFDGVGVVRLGPEMTVSSDGTVMYLSGSAGVRVQPSWVNEQGAMTPVDPAWSFLTATLYSTAVLSPDGSRAAVSQGMGTEQQIWVRRLPNGPNTAVTSPSRVNGRAHWTPDGRALVFVSDRGTRNQVWRQAADGSSPPELLVAESSNEGLISPDSSWLIHRGASPERHIYARPLRGDTSRRVQVRNDRGEDLAPMLSPDGQWLAYVAAEAGRNDVFIRPFPDVSRAVIPVSIAGGVEPLWSRDGRTLYYRSGADSIMRVSLERRGGTLVPGEPRALFSMAEMMPANPFQTTYDVTADGKRFFVLRRVRTGGVGEGEQLIVVENLAEHLRRMERR